MKFMDKLKSGINKTEKFILDGMVITGKLVMMFASVGAVVYAVGATTGLYDLSFIANHFNVSTAELGWATIAPSGVYTSARVIDIMYRGQKKYRADLDKFNTDRVVNAQEETRLSIVENTAKLEVVANQNVELLKLEAQKAAKVAEIENKMKQV